MKTKTINDQIIAIIGKKNYFSFQRVEQMIIDSRSSINSPSRLNRDTLKKSLSRMQLNKIIFDAGRGWYSTVARGFELETESVDELIREIKSRFPLMEFSCWSTKQLQSFAHHMMTKFVAFVYADVDFLPSINEHLDEKSYNVYRNPTKPEIRKYYSLKERTCVLRPRISEEPVKGRYASIEKILVDLYIEKNRVNLMDGSEYKRIFENLVTAYRINIGRLLRYANRREVKESLMKDVFREGIFL